jgi:hypothetical protein
MPHRKIGSRSLYEGEFIDRQGSCRRNCDHRISKLHDLDDEQHDK